MSIADHPRSAPPDQFHDANADADDYFPATFVRCGFEVQGMHLQSADGGHHPFAGMALSEPDP